jgi:hypothetical protein
LFDWRTGNSGFLSQSATGRNFGSSKFPYMGLLSTAAPYFIPCSSSSLTHFCQEQSASFEIKNGPTGRKLCIAALPLRPSFRAETQDCHTPIHTETFSPNLKFCMPSGGKKVQAQGHIKCTVQSTYICHVNPDDPHHKESFSPNF